MMFKIAPAKFSREVTARVPVDGGFEDQTMKVTYKTLAQSKVDEMLKPGRGGEGVRDYVKAVVERIDDLVDDSGKPVTWNDSIKDQILSLPYAFWAIERGYAEAMTEAKAKN